MTDIISIGKIAISPENPSGEDARYEPEYEEIQAEIEKLASPTSQEGVNWHRVTELGIAILTEKSKNLLVASYLFVALLESKGADQLGPAMAMYRGVVENFWDTLYPPKKRKKARINALEWWAEKVQGMVENLPQDAALEEEAKTALIEDLTALDQFLAEHLEDAPLLHPLKNRLDAIPMIPKPEPEPEVEEVTSDEAAGAGTESATDAGAASNAGTAPGAEGPPAAEPNPAAPTPPKKQTPTPAAPPPAPPPAAPEDSDGSPEPFFKSGTDHFRRAAGLMMRQNAADPLAYRLNRIAAWLTAGLPPAEDGMTLLPPPMDEEKDALAGLYEKQNFQSLLESAESRVGQYLFWLDLSRYVSESLFHLGFSEARQAVDEETGRYARRLSGIENLPFSDGTPFADEKTRDWLQEISRSEGGEITMAASASADSESALMADIYQKAKTYAGEGKPMEGLDLLQTHFNEAASRKSTLLWRMDFIRYLVSIQQPRLALPHVREILEDLERYAVEVWDPAFALNALVRAYEGLKHQKDDGLKDDREAVLDRIARLNPAAALRLV